MCVVSLLALLGVTERRADDARDGCVPERHGGERDDRGSELWSSELAVQRHASLG